MLKVMIESLAAEIIQHVKAAQMAGRHNVSDAPPPYQPPSSDWYAAPPPAYSANPAGYGGWVPPTHVFPNMVKPKKSSLISQYHIVNLCKVTR